MHKKWNHRPPPNPKQAEVPKRTRGVLSSSLPAKAYALFCYGLVPLTLLLLPACSKEFTKIRPEPATVRTCSREADEALKRGDYETSVRLHGKLLEMEPDNALALYHLGYAYGQLGQHEKEIDFYEKAVSLGLANSTLFFNFGMALGELNQVDRALLMFNRGLDLDPEHLETRLFLSLLYEETGRRVKALEQLRKILEIDPDHDRALKMLRDIEKQ